MAAARKRSVTKECPSGSFLVTDWLEASQAETIYQTLLNEVQFKKMHNFGSVVPRLVCVQAAVDEEGTVPVYRHPVDASPEIQPWSETVSKLVVQLNQLLGSKLNHALIQLYRSGEDNISEHSDKTLDIVPGSLIANVSFGAKRVLTLRSKKVTGVFSAQTEAQPRQRINIALPHNSVFCLNLRTNAYYTHAIRPNKKLRHLQDEEELAFDGARISLTLREIGTFLTKDGKIYGTGATAKTREEAKCVPSFESSAWSELIDAFGRENKSQVLDWSSYYGSGFDTLR